MTMRLKFDENPMNIWWLSNDYPMTIRWVSDDYPMTIRWVFDDYPMTIWGLSATQNKAKFNDWIRTSFKNWVSDWKTNQQEFLCPLQQKLSITLDKVKRPFPFLKLVKQIKISGCWSAVVKLQKYESQVFFCKIRKFGQLCRQVGT